MRIINNKQIDRYRQIGRQTDRQTEERDENEIFMCATEENFDRYTTNFLDPRGFLSIQRSKDQWSHKPQRKKAAMQIDRQIGKGWMDGWMDGCIDGCKDSWMHGCVHG